MNRRACASLAAMLTLTAAPCAAETLSEAVQSALTGNPALAAAQARQDGLAEAPEQARTRGRLSAALDGSGGYDRFDYDKGGGATVSASLPIWSGGRVANAVRAADHDTAAGREGLRDTTAELIAAVVSTYCDVLYGQQAMTIVQTDIELLQHQVAEATARFGLGRATRTDVAQLEAQLASAQGSLADAQSALEAARAHYRALVGHAPDGLEPLPDLLIGLPPTRDEARQRAVAENPLYRRDEQAVRAAEARVGAARSQGAPTLSLGGSYGYGYSSAGSAGYVRNSAVGLTLHVPILTGGLVASQVRQAGAELRAARFDMDAAGREATRQVDTAWAGLDAARRRLAANQRRLEAADLALRGVRAEYAFDLRSTLDILVADENLRAAQLAMAQSRSDVLLSQTALLRAIGGLSLSSFDPASVNDDH